MKVVRQIDRNHRLSIPYLSGLPLLIVSTIAVRVYLYFFTYLISPDGVTYLALGDYFKQGQFARALAHDYHPLYSMLIGALSQVLKDSQLGGQIISVISGSLLVVLIFYLGKSLFNESIAFLSGLLVAFHPYLARISAEVLSDSLYIVFFVAGVCAGWEALKRKHRLWFFLTGVFASFAYLTRPEGIGLLIVIGFWILAAEGWRAFHKKNLVGFLLLVFGFLIFASPYVIYLRKDTGHWALTRKKSLRTLIGVEKNSSQRNDTRIDQSNTEKNLKQEKGRVSALHATKSHASVFGSKTYLKAFKRFFHLLYRFFKAFHPLLFVLALVGILKRREIGGFDQSDGFILSFYVLYLSILYLLLLNVGYVSHRHFLPLVPIGLFWASIGIQACHSWLVHKVSKLKRWGHLSSRMILVTLLIFISAILLPKTLRPQRRDKILIKEAGIWIARNGPQNPKIVSDDPRIAYYARGTSIAIFSGKTSQEIERLATEGQVDFVVLRSDQIKESSPEFLLGNSRTFNFVHRLVDQRGEKILVYRVFNH